MKATMISLLQQRMDKCTNEQFWAVASLTAADAFIVTAGKNVWSKIPYPFLLGAITLVTAYGIYFIIHRHFAFYRNRTAIALLLADDPDAPDFLKTEPNLRTFNSLSGVAFYVVWVGLGYAMCLFAIG